MNTKTIVGFTLCLILRLDAQEQQLPCEVVPLDVVWGLSTRQGDREAMEDTHVSELNFKNDPQKAFFAVYDGHNGKAAADIAAAFLHRRLYLDDVSSENAYQDVKRAMARAYAVVDRQIMKHTSAGTCAVTAYFNRDDLYLAWAGDSRAIVVRGCNVIAATADHKPDNPKEEERIKRAGGEVIISDAPRVNGRLAVARALGDKYLKIAGDPIIATPDVMQEKVRTGDLVILACDGVWDVMSNQEVAAMARYALTQSCGTLQEKYPAIPSNRKFWNPAFCTAPRLPAWALDTHVEEAGDKRYKLVARVLRDEAYQRGSRDNISVLVIAVQ
jgi:protein phosphatase 2C family protein 2/3